MGGYFEYFFSQNRLVLWVSRRSDEVLIIHRVCAKTLRLCYFSKSFYRIFNIVRYRLLKSLMLLLGILLLLSGCSSVPATFKEILKKKPALSLGLNETAHPFQLYKIKMDLWEQQQTGRAKRLCRGNSCSNKPRINWLGNFDVTTQKIANYFYEKFKESGYPVRKTIIKKERPSKKIIDPQNSFEEETKRFPNFLIGGKIVEYKPAYKMSEFFITEGAYLIILWQVYSKEKREVVFEVLTIGATANPGSISQGFNFALLNNIDNLLGDKSFNEFIKIKH